MAAGRVITESHAARAATVASQQVRRHATFIEKDVLAHIAEGLPGAPRPTGRDNVRPSLFVGVYRFFDGQLQAINRSPQGAQRRCGGEASRNSASVASGWAVMSAASRRSSA